MDHIRGELIQLGSAKEVKKKEEKTKGLIFHALRTEIGNGP